MTPRENLLNLYRRNGYDYAPAGFHLCPSLEEEFYRRYPDSENYLDYFQAPYRIIYDPGFPWNFEEKHRIPGRENFDWMQFYPEGFNNKFKLDLWGTAHENGSDAACHMTQMHHPMKNFDSVAQMKEFPWPDFQNTDFSYLEKKVNAIHEKNLAVFVWAECTIWETSWYLRSMDKIMIDMAMEDEKATFLLDKITDLACYRAEKFAEAGVDILGLGDDIGMQESIMMSEDMYRKWLKSRLKKVISAAKKIKPDIIIQYHSCGFITPLISDLIDAGVDVLNPVQPECMDFKEIHAKFGDKLSFNGTIGTQTTMPFGTPEQIKEEVTRNLKIAGEKGGLFCCPTHMLEPEVPWENIEAYAKACRDFET